MKITAISVILLLGSSGVYGESKASDRTTIVCTEGGAKGLAAIHTARMLANRMFGGVGVGIDWRQTLRACPAEGILVSLSQKTPLALKSGALAYAIPYEGAHIRVFYDRISKKFEPARVPIVLAYVLVHEITHILQGIDRHSDYGIMKASWDAQDLFEMGCRRLTFAQEDIGFIHRGLAASTPRVMEAFEPGPGALSIARAAAPSLSTRAISVAQSHP